MEQCIQEHHGYFSMDMNCFTQAKFENSACIGERFCMVFLERGTMEIRLENGEWKKEIGSVLLCKNEQEVFEVVSQEAMEIVVLHPHILNSVFDFENIRGGREDFSVSEEQDCYFLTPFLERNDRADGIYHPDGFLAKRIASLIQQFKREITLQDTNYWPCKSRSCLMEILSFVMSGREEEEDSDAKLISEVKSYLVSHMEKKITIPELTKEFHKNRTDLSGLFLAETGQTIMEYLKEQRMEFAAALVRGTGLPFTVIMERVGYFEYAYFSRSFKAYTGKSPREYRKCFGGEE